MAGRNIDISDLEEQTVDLISGTSGTQQGCITSLSLRTSEGKAYTMGRVQVGPTTTAFNIVPPENGIFGGFAATEANEYCAGTSGGCWALLVGVVACGQGGTRAAYLAFSRPAGSLAVVLEQMQSISGRQMGRKYGRWQDCLLLASK